jgi:multidrug efflux system outer membrane protein
LSLISDVANAYFQLLELDQELEIESRTTNSFQESLRIFNRRMEGGTASGLESSRAQAALYDAAAAVPVTRERISATENQLCILLGRNPGPVVRPALLLTKVTLPEIPAGLPSTLLDEVLEAQQQLFPAQLNLARTQRDQLLATVGLYKALGRGWHEEADFDSSSSNKPQ